MALNDANSGKNTMPSTTTSVQPSSIVTVNNDSNKTKCYNNNSNKRCVSPASTASTTSTSDISNKEKKVGNGNNNKPNKKSNNRGGNQNKSKAAEKKKKRTNPVAVAEAERKHQAQFVAMDCEMVGVGYDGATSIAARVTIVDWNHNVLLDQFIRPDRPVTDYRTHVSGITPADIEYNPQAVSIHACRRNVMALLKDKILVGHGLRNDLFAMGVYHPWFMIRDTARYEPFMKLRYQDETNTLWPRKLKDLCFDYLQIEIQTYGYAHSSYEDAVAALELYKVVAHDWEQVVKYKLRKTVGIQKKQQKKLLKKQLLQEQEKLMPLEQNPDQNQYQHEQEHVSTVTTSDETPKLVCSEDEHTSSVSSTSEQSSAFEEYDEDDDENASIYSNYYDAASHHEDEYHHSFDCEEYMMMMDSNIKDVPLHVSIATENL